ncbi:MAG: outer membrane protein assembly factor BamE, partial [Paracoccaceae bacterium]|nr:outer membrane protein assembly factor BamE [Paracoccaceae bacterium]
LVDRQVVVVSFDSHNRVSNVAVLGLEDGQVIVLSQRVTETISGDFGFFKQLFGNLGNFDASQIIDG